MKVAFTKFRNITFLFLLNACLWENSYTPLVNPSSNPRIAAEKKTCPNAPEFRSVVRASSRPHCHKHRITKLSRDLRNYYETNNEFRESPECVKEVFKDVAKETKTVREICQPYVSQAGSSKSPQDSSLAYEHCIEAALRLSIHQDDTQLTIDEALNLRKAGKLAFHVTSADRTENILDVGLDPQLGGHPALADYYRNTPEIGARNKEFKIPITGTTFVTTDSLIASEYADIYRFASADARIFGVRLDKIKRTPQDTLNHVTKEWIGSEDLVEIPWTQAKAFGLLSPTAARLARIRAESAKIFPNPTPQWIDPAIVRFSQDTVSGAGEITESMKKTGWIDFEGPMGVLTLIKMADGALTTVDNTRILAASRTGAYVKAVIKAETEPLTSAEAKRFTTKYDGTPKTWKEAVEFRVRCSKSTRFKSKYPQGSYMIGSKE